MENIHIRHLIKQNKLFKKTTDGKDLKSSICCYPEQLVGIEVEAENFTGLDNSFDVTKCWRVSEDGSLRNSGVEFISLPMPARVVKSALELLFSSIPEDHPLDFSKRTSIHIHMNVLDDTYEELLNLIMLYVVFEDALFRFAGGFRKKSIFCVPLKETTLLSPSILSDISLITEGVRWLKYSACNLLPVSYLGTVEFRHLRGTDDIDTIVTWVELLCRLKLAAKEHSFKDLQKDIFNLTTTSQYYLFALSVFKDDLGKIFPEHKFPLTELDASVKFLKSYLCTTSLTGLPVNKTSPYFK